MAKDTRTSENPVSKAVQSLLDRHVPAKFQGAVWFALLWLFGLTALFILAYGLRLIMGIS